MSAGHRRAGHRGAAALLLALSSAGGCAARTVPDGELPFTIEKPAILASGNPAPRYPTELLPRSDTAIVVIRVAVDPSGRADTSSVEVLRSPDPAFTKAVLEVLPSYQFLAAEIGGGPPRNCRMNERGIRTCQPGRPGTKVRSLVEIPFRFVPPPAAGSDGGAKPR